MAEGTDLASLVEQILSRLREAATQVRILVSARSDLLRLRAHRALLRLQAAVLLTAAGAAIVVAGIVLLSAGMAEGLGLLVGDRPWLGKLLAGALLLTSAGAGVWLHGWRTRRLHAKELRRKYESLERTTTGTPPQEDGRGTARERARQRTGPPDPDAQGSGN